MVVPTHSCAQANTEEATNKLEGQGPLSPALLGRQSEWPESMQSSFELGGPSHE